jgi:hypothetical protein
MKYLYLTIIITASLLTGSIFGGAYTQHKLAVKFEEATAMLADIDRLTLEVCNVINR